MKSKQLYHIALGFLFLIFLITRLWRIDIIPFGLHYDEAGMAYDAWCLSQYGVDRYLNSWPLYLTNYGGGQSILYAYLCAALFRIFGYHSFLVRLPSILFSSLTLFFGVKITEKLYPGKYMPALAAGILLTICPALILQGRLGIDCYLMLGASTVFLYLFLCAAETGKVRYYIGAGLSGGLLLYTYALTYFVLPLFLAISLFYVLWVKRFSLRGWAAMAVPMAVLAFPLILIQIINIFDLPEMKLGCFTLTKLNMYRVSEFTGFDFSKFLSMLRMVFIGNELSYTSAPGFFNFYILSIPLFFIGFCSLLWKAWRSIAKRKHVGSIYVLLWFLIIFLLFCNLKPIGYRISGIYFAVVAITVCGLQSLLCFLSRKKILKISLSAAFSAFYLVGFARFGFYYYMGAYTAETNPLTHFDILVTEAVEYLAAHPEFQNQGTYMAEPVVYYMLSTLASPYDVRYDIHTLDSDYYVCGSLPEIQDGYNYIVRNHLTEYAEELRRKGYTEVIFTGYSLFYQEADQNGISNAG